MDQQEPPVHLGVPERRRRPSLLAIAFVALVSALVGALLALSAVAAYVLVEGLPVGGSTTIIKANGAAGGGAGLTSEQVYRLYSPSVVHITSEIVTQDFQNPFGIPVPQQGQAIGSGFVVDSRGYILTNQHVVDGATKITVTLESGRALQAKLLGEDRSTDLAVLKIDAPMLPKALTLADSDEVQVGNYVYAIGNPLGLDRTMTSGIVSAVDREIKAPNKFIIRNVIQTDAAINQGNSGGPLLDIYGRVIGINSQIISQSGGSEGIAFAVPSNTVKGILEQIKKTGTASHAWLGVVGLTITPDMRRVLRIPTSSGALITDVFKGSPADKAGLRGGKTRITIGGSQFTVGGDIIVAIDGKKTAGMDEVVAEIERHDVSARVTMSIYRDGKKRTITATLANRPANLSQ